MVINNDITCSFQIIIILEPYTIIIVITFLQYSCDLCFGMIYIIKWIYAKQLVLL